MISVNLNIAKKIQELLRQINDIIPIELRPMVDDLNSQLDNNKCEEGILVEILTLLQDSCENNEKCSQQKPQKKKDKSDLEKINELSVLLAELNLQGQQNQIIRIRR